MLITLLAASTAARGQTCPNVQYNSDAYTNAGATGQSCAIPANVQVGWVLAGSGPPVQANGVTITIPYDTPELPAGVAATSGGSVTLAPDSQGNASTIAPRYGGGGLIGLLANGSGSLITATGLTMNFTASGNIIALAESGGRIDFASGTLIFLSGGGGSHGLWASGAGSLITADGLTLSAQTGGNDYPVASELGAEVDLENSTISLDSPGGGITGMLASSGGTLSATNVALGMVAGGGDVAVRALGGSTVTLQGGTVDLSSPNSGETGLLVQGSTLSATGVVVGVNAGSSYAGELSGGQLSFTGGSLQAEGSNSVGVLINGTTTSASTLELSDTVLASTAESFAVTGAGNVGITVDDSTVTDNGGVLLSATGAATAFEAGGSVLSGAMLTGAGATTDVTLNGSLWTVTGSSNATSLTNSASTIRLTGPAAGADPALPGSYKTLEVANYSASSGGTLEINTYLDTDGSASDRLIIDGGTATGVTSLIVRNTSGPGAETEEDGIQVVQAVNGGTTAEGAFVLDGEVRAGAFDYRLFRGSVTGGSSQDWFLRSTMISPGPPGETTPPEEIPGPAIPVPPGEIPSPPEEITPPEEPGPTPELPTPPTPEGPTPPEPPPTPPAPPAPPTPPPTPETPAPPTAPAPEPPSPPAPPEVLPPTPPPTESEKPELPPGRWPIIGPELATDGVIQPIARQMGLTILGTLHERVGDTVEDIGADDVGSGSVWGRFFFQQIDNQYQAFADPSDSGQVVGGQAGLDLFRDESESGQRNVAGVYFAYSAGNAQVQGLVTNAQATGYVMTDTGSVALDGYTGGAYWTHYGPSNWYVDAVAQGTFYEGSARTQYADLTIRGSGIVASMEGGYPFPLPLGPQFVLEPQLQAIWQRVSLNPSNDGVGPVDLGETTGVTGRIGVRGEWSIERDNGQLWQPYWRVNLWHDWGGAAATQFGSDEVPLLEEEASRLELAFGFSARITQKVSLYGQTGYQLAVGGTDGGRRQGAAAGIGARYVW